MKKFILILSILTFLSCSNNWRKYYRNVNVNPEKFYLNMPKTYEESLTLFDTIFSNKVKTYFKNRDSSIAYIELSKDVGGLFINFWNLRRYSNMRSDYTNYLFTKRYSYKPAIIDSFTKSGITDPEEMIRILFYNYHKKINNKDYSWNQSICKIESYWETAKKGKGWVSQKVKIYENEKIVDYHFKELYENDTVNILYNRSPRILNKMPDWFYLTGVIQKKFEKEKTITVKLIDIKNEFEKAYFINSKNDTLRIVDTLNDYSKGWLKKGIYYLNYKTNEEFRDGIKLN